MFRGWTCYPQKSEVLSGLATGVSTYLRLFWSETDQAVRYSGSDFLYIKAIIDSERPIVTVSYKHDSKSHRKQFGSWAESGISCVIEGCQALWTRVSYTGDPNVDPF